MKHVEQPLREAGPHATDEAFNGQVAGVVAAAVQLRIVPDEAREEVSAQTAQIDV